MSEPSRYASSVLTPSSSIGEFRSRKLPRSLATLQLTSSADESPPACSARCRRRASRSWESRRRRSGRRGVRWLRAAAPRASPGRVRDIATTPVPRRRAQLQHVAGERGELLHAELDELVPGATQGVHHGAALVRADAVRADRREARTDAHQHVGVIDRRAGRIGRLERDDVVIELLGEIAEHVEIGARRHARIRDAMRAIQHEAARPFQELAAALVMREVEHARDAKAQPRADRLQQIRAALLPAILREHRIQHDGAVGVKADPVVRKDRVRSVRLRCVVEGVDVHARRAQRVRERLELPRGGGLHLRGRQVRRAVLKAIGLRGLRVTRKLQRTDHQDVGGALELFGHRAAY